MKKKIAILGSTGSIGKSTLNVINKDKNFFKIVLLTANNNYKKLIQQAKKFKAQNVIIANKRHYHKLKIGLKNTKTKVYAGKVCIKDITSEKIDLTMSSIVGLAGLQPTVDAIKVSKTVALANKETIICGWSILSKFKKKYKTEIIPVDSEHFSIMEQTKNIKDDQIQEIIITASGGPFLKTPTKKLNHIKAKQATKHPNWRMGKKISVDSANMMNKVFEVIEAYKIFGFSKNKYKIMIHPHSYVHSIINIKNGLIKMLLYKPDMKVPISNILYKSDGQFSKVIKVDSKILNNMNFQKVNIKKFPSIKLIKKCFNSGTSTPIIVNASNEVLVDLFLRGKIAFLDIVKTINKIFKDQEFKKYARREPRSVKDIITTDKWARLKTMNMCVR